jgi:hypothetical protein
MDTADKIDWRAAANEALRGAEGEMTKVAVGTLAAAAAGLERSYNVDAEKALQTIAQGLQACADIAFEEFRVVPAVGPDEPQPADQRRLRLFGSDERQAY